MPKRVAVRRPPSARPLPSMSGVARTAEMVERPVVPDDEVRREAYRRWEVAGRPPGDGVAFWLEAERAMRSDV